MLRLASLWAVPACTAACLTALAALPAEQLTEDAISLIGALPSDVSVHPLYAPVAANCALACADLEAQRAAAAAQLPLDAAGLLTRFGNVPQVLREAPLLGAFCRLPFAAVKLWAAQGELFVESEDSVAVALSLWWQRNVAAVVPGRADDPGSKQPPSSSRIGPGGASAAATTMDVDDVPKPGAAGTTGNASASASPAGAAAVDLCPHAAARARELSQLLRLPHLTDTYAQAVLPQLPWFRPDPELLAAFKLQVALLQPQPYPDDPRFAAFPAAWHSRCRRHPQQRALLQQFPGSCCTRGLINHDAIMRLAGSPGIYTWRPLTAAGFYYNGYQWVPGIFRSGARDFHVGLSAQPPPGLSFKLPGHLSDATMELSWFKVLNDGQSGGRYETEPIRVEIYDLRDASEEELRSPARVLQLLRLGSLQEIEAAMKRNKKKGGWRQVEMRVRVDASGEWEVWEQHDEKWWGKGGDDDDDGEGEEDDEDCDDEDEEGDEWEEDEEEAMRNMDQLTAYMMYLSNK